MHFNREKTSVLDSNWQERARQIAHRVRCRVLEHVIKNNGGYLSQACSSAETLATLYVKIMNLGPSQGPMIPQPFSGVPSADNPDYFRGSAYNGPKSPELDRFFFGPVHYSLVLYSVLIEVGRMAPSALDQFNQDGSTVEMIGAEHSPGIELTSGSLAQTLSQAGGIALARKLKGETGRCWVYLSDGEFQEGQTYEAFQALAYYNIDNIGVYVDVNGQQCDGKMTDVMNIEPLKERLEAFGARVFKVNGHDVNELAAPASLKPDGRPLVVLAYTDPCRGISLLEERRPRLHYVRFKSEEEKQRYIEYLKLLKKELEVEV
ncbi:MAG: transketolase [Promethearchaeota archaeon]